MSKKERDTNLITLDLPESMLKAIDERISGTENTRERDAFWLLYEGLQQAEALKRADAMLSDLHDQARDQDQTAPRSRKPQKATEGPEALDGKESDPELESLQEPGSEAQDEEPLQFYNPRR